MLRERKLNRLSGYDYSDFGYYFVTICTQNRELFFGDVENQRMILNEFGKIADKCWRDLPNHYWNCKLDEFVIMPNHVHGIIVIDNDTENGFRFCVGNGLKPFPTNKNKYSLSEMMRGFKTFSSHRINKTQNIIFRFQWQKSFYDRIIRNNSELYRIRNYIINNPLKWDFDRNNPDNLL
ncbi:MAG: transposase [bacterium]